MRRRSTSASAPTKDPTRYTVYSQPGAAGPADARLLPAEGAKYDAIRKAYRDYIVRIRSSRESRTPAPRRTRFIALETALPKDQWTPERRRDPQATYNPMTLAQLAEPRAAVRLDRDAGAYRTRRDADRHRRRAERGRRRRQAHRRPAAGRRGRIISTFRFISDHAQFLPKAFDDAQLRLLRQDAETRARRSATAGSAASASRRRSGRSGRPALHRSATGRPRPSAR